MRIIAAITVLLLPSMLFSQEPVLDRYIREGLANNLALKQREFSLEKSLEVLSEARGLYMPSISIAARYTRAGGGRYFEIPIGDLMNPVYQALNELYVGQGQEPRPFPALENETIPFLLEEEQETKIRVVQPLFEPVIYYNYKIKSDLSRIQEAGKNIYRRKLIADIKSAYYNYLKMIRVVELLEETMELVTENLRISEALFGTGKATQDVVFRAKAEISKIEQGQAEAEKDRRLAISYFNFLLNRPRDSAIDPSEELSFEENRMDRAMAERMALERREELEQLESGISAAANNIKLASSRFLPSVNFVFDYGFWGEDYRFSGDDDFWMGSFLLDWNLFDGFQKKSKRDQAVIERKELETRLDEVQQQIKLEVQEAYDNVVVAKLAIASSRDQVISARKSFRIVRRKYEEGMSPQVEFLDARTTLTRSEINHIMAQYTYLVRYAELERVTASLDQNEY